MCHWSSACQWSSASPRNCTWRSSIGRVARNGRWLRSCGERSGSTSVLDRLDAVAARAICSETPVVNLIAPAASSGSRSPIGSVGPKPLAEGLEKVSDVVKSQHVELEIPNAMMPHAGEVSDGGMLEVDMRIERQDGGNSLPSDE